MWFCVCADICHHSEWQINHHMKYEAWSLNKLILHTVSAVQDWKISVSDISKHTQTNINIKKVLRKGMYLHDIRENDSLCPDRYDYP